MEFNELCDKALAEALGNKPTKVKTKSRMADILSQWENEMNISGKELTKKTQTDITKPTKLKVADLAKTRQKIADLQMTPEIGNKLAAIDQNAEDLVATDDEDEDEGFDIQEVTPETLPDIINNALVGTEDLRPEWHQVKNLPGYLKGAIRQVGKAVFKPFTNIPIDEINVIANVAGAGPNEERELNAVASYLTKNAIRNGEAELKFKEIIPDYEADVKIYNAHNISFMAVKDFAGEYIYSWPEATIAGKEKPAGEIE